MIPGAPVQSRSLSDVHSSVSIDHVTFWRRMLAFAGPAYLVSVGYMDPATGRPICRAARNSATGCCGCWSCRTPWRCCCRHWARAWASSPAAIWRRPAAKPIRARVNLALWLLCEIAIVACDLAEVLGAAIALNLLFHIPLLLAVAMTALDTLLVLWLQKFGIRYLEAVILGLIVVIAVCFPAEIFMARPDLLAVAAGWFRGSITAAST